MPLKKGLSETKNIGNGKNGIDEADIVSDNTGGKSFNGAQVQAINDIVSSVASGDITRDSGINQLVILFGVTKDQAERIIGESGTKTGAQKQGTVIQAIEGK